jgi:hypothetical protein
MGFLKPKMPPMPTIPAPEPLPEPPSFEDEERAAEVAEKRRKVLQNRKGRRSTILTGADGLEDDDSTIKKKTLLGD